MINESLPFNRDYKRDLNIKALRRKGFINQGSTLVEILVIIVINQSWFIKWKRK